jgi:hypothetical protein
VTWTASAGTISSGGVYTAPAPVPATAATITATSKTDTTVPATAAVTFTPVSVAITTTPVAMVAGATQTFADTVTGDTALNAGVTWSASVGSITAGGVYTAPTPVAVASATITATSKTDATQKATAAVILTPVSVAITTTPVAMVAGATQTFAATVSNDVTPSAGVTWSASVGTITTGGVYTAPTPVGAATATITATSKTDTSKTNTATVTLTPITVTIPTTPTAIAGAATEAITATLTGDATLNAGVTWSITNGGGSLTAVTSTSVTYNAPLPVTTANAVITAASKTDNTKTATITIPLTPISVAAISPATASMGTGGSQAFTDSVNNDSSNSGVTWSIGSGVGTFTASSTTGVTYNAPTTVISSVTTVTLTATSIKDNTKTTTATITLNPVSVAVSPTTATMVAGQTQTFTPTVSNDGATPGVTWTASVGSITAGGVYTAPTPVPSGTTSATITAISKTDTTKTAIATVTLTPVAVSVSPTTATVIGGASTTIVATVTGDTALNKGVTWTVSPSTGAGTVTTGGVYTAPAVIGSIASATVTATSVTDPSKSASATITLSPIGITFTTVTTGITLDSGQTLPLAAAVANDGSASGATFAATGAGTVSPSSATGNAPATTLTATGTTASIVSVTATGIKDTTKSAITVPIPVNPALTITTAAGALTAGMTGSVYAGTTIATSGGTGTKTFVATGLPTGLAIGNAGAISGTPTATAGTYSFTVKVTDSATTPVSVTSGTYTIAVAPAPLTWTAPTGGTLTYTVGTAITPINLTTTGGTGPIGYSVNSGGTLPAGLSISGNQIVGTPTQPTVVGGTVYTFKATDSASTPVTAISASVTLIANPVTLAVSTPTLPTGFVNSAYNGTGYQFLATGGTGTIAWTMSPTNVVGLMLSNTGLLAGTPNASYGPNNISVTATDSATNQKQTITITPSLTVSNALTVTTGTTLPNGTVGTAYSQTLAASGGSGTGYTWAITGTNTLTAIGLSLNTSSGVTSIYGSTPTAGSATFTAQVTDSLGNKTSATFTVTVYAPLALPTPNPTSLPSATTTASYTGYINATGGVSPYTWTVTGLSNGLTSSNSGGNTLTISGSPTTTGTVTFNVTVKDSAGTTVGPTQYTIAVSTTYNIGGTITNNNNCGTTIPTIALTLKQGSNIIQTQSTDSNGNFTFTGIANGPYTITPTIAGPTSVFYPATQSVTVASSNITTANFSAALGYNVSGTASYTGLQTGQIYLTLYAENCGGQNNGSLGTSISTKGAYTIHGVPPGTYTLRAFMDPSTLGKGVVNAASPSGVATGSNVFVTSANVSGADVTLTDPAKVTLGTSTPVLQGGGGFNIGAMLAYNPITITDTNGNSIETATSYTLQWSTTPAFTVVAGSKTFPAVGSQTGPWMLNTTSSPSLTSGGSFYFRAFGTSAGTAQSNYSNVVGPYTISAPNPTGGNAVSGAVTFTGVTPSGPLGVGFFDQSTGNFYGEGFANPVSAQAYTIQVPNGSNYFFVGILDQNNDGAIDAGDLQNITKQQHNTVTTISGPTTNLNLTLPTGSATTTVNTAGTKSSNGTSYTLGFQVNGLLKLPVAVSLSSSTNADGANVITPMDISVCAVVNNNTCSGGSGFVYYVNSGVVPAVGDSYTFAITYSDATTANLTAAVTGVMNAFATLTSPTGTSSTDTPTFTWTDPTSASSYTYQFQLTPQGSGQTIWQIPNNNGTLTSSTTSIPWITSGNDVTGNPNVPSVSALTSGTGYTWQISVVDTNGNSDTTQTNFTAH